MLPACPNEQRALLLQLVLQHGACAVSFQALQSGYRYFWYGDAACVAYVDTGRAWVAAGSPIASASQQAEVARAFLLAARAAGARACFFATETPLAVHGSNLRSLAMGEQPVWDPRTWPVQLKEHRSLREQLRRARAKGVRTRLLAPGELISGAARGQIAQVTKRWLASRAMAPMAFLVRVEPFELVRERVTFVAEQGARVVGFANAVPVPARGGWFLQDLVRDPQAPNGTGESLVHAIMSWASDAGCTWLTLGLAPLSGTVPGLLTRVRQATRLLYDFAGLRAYKAKFRPASWQPVYLYYPESQAAWRSVVDVLAAFADGNLLRFTLYSLLRGPTNVLRGLAILLVPWTGLLALAPSERWFGTAGLKWAWVSFDVALALGLFRFLHKPKLGLLRVLALGVSADAVMTCVEAVTWNARHAQRIADYLLLGVACLGPLLAAGLLWGARHHRFRVT